MWADAAQAAEPMIVPAIPPAEKKVTELLVDLCLSVGTDRAVGALSVLRLRSGPAWHVNDCPLKVRGDFLRASSQGLIPPALLRPL